MTESRRPQPWPRQPQASGALYGELPLTLPRNDKACPVVVIVSRENGVTSYEVRPKKGGEPDRGKIDTIDEWILAQGVYIKKDRKSGIKRLKTKSMIVARIVAGRNPSEHQDRIYVDHADRDSLNDTSANLHWVTPAFNVWNRERKVRGLPFGVYRVGRGKKLIETQFRDVSQGYYDDVDTAGRVYDLVVRLAYGDQVDKTPHLLNHTELTGVLVESREDGANVWKVNDVYLVIHDENVRSQHASLEEARMSATTYVAEAKAEQKEKEEEWAKERQKLIREGAVTHNKDGIAFLPMKLSEEKRVEVLMDDETWLDLVSTGAKLRPSFGLQPSVRIDGKAYLFNRFLRPAAGEDIVDHVNRNVLDHRLDNLEVRDRSANAQNRSTSKRFLGIYPTKAGGWIVLVKIKGRYQMVSKTFAATEVNEAIKLYDLAALWQHGPSAHINDPSNVGKYLEALDTDDTRTLIEAFLDPQTKPSKAETTEEVKANIIADLRKMKEDGTEFTVKYEFMRPCYLYWLPNFESWCEQIIANEAFKDMGGEDFVREMEERVDSPSPSPATSPTQAGKRKRDD